MRQKTASVINQLLPQTQCGLCGHPGCLPYAEALARGDANIDLCPPGGTKGLLALGNLLSIDPTPYLSEMKKKAKPPSRALVREAECIGCTKCIQACPVDAILGAAKSMHTVLLDECTGCELCIAPCPVDCIEMVVIERPGNTPEHFRKRYEARQERLQKKRERGPVDEKPVLKDKGAYLEAALLRKAALKK